MNVAVLVWLLHAHKGHTAYHIYKNELQFEAQQKWPAADGYLDIDQQCKSATVPVW